MNYLINLLAIVGGLFLAGRLWATVKTVWASRGTMFNMFCAQIDTLSGRKGVSKNLKKFCEPMLPAEPIIKEEVKGEDEKL